MNTKSLATGALAVLLAFAASGAFAMQSIKGTPAERLLLDKWTEQAQIALRLVNEATSSLRMGRNADLAQLDKQLASLTQDFSTNRFGTPALKSEMTKVQGSIETLRRELATASSPRVVSQLLIKFDSLLKLHTTSPAP
jgi:hypothetical protein